MPRRYGWDDFVLDLDAYRLERGGRTVPLEPKALDLLALMVQQPGHLFTKQHIFDTLWRDTAVTDHALTRVVSQLRRALGDEARDAQYLETVPTRGYRWVALVTALDPGVAIEVEAPPPETSPPVPPIAIPASVPAARVPTRIVALVVVATAVIGLVWALSAARGPAASESRSAAAGGPPDAGSAPHGLAWPRQATSHPALEMHPEVAPQGDAIAFASSRSGAFEVYVRAMTEGAAEVPLTQDAGENVQPAWSPDGTQIAYHSARRGGIWVVPARGGVAKQIVTVGSRPAWSRDGRLAYQSDEHADVSPVGYDAQSGSTLWVTDGAGGHPRPLTEAGRPLGGHASPAWSPDGRFVAFAVFDGVEDNGIWLLEVATGRLEQLAAGQSLFEPAFAPDGASVYVAGGVALLHRIPIAPATGTIAAARESIPVPGVPGVRGLSIWPDGSRIAFAGPSLSSQLWSQPLAASAPSGLATALTRDTGRRTSSPALSPDGTRLAYMSARHGESPQVWMMSDAGDDPVQLTSGGVFNGRPRWLPDGKRVAYISNREGGNGIWVSDIETRREARLVDLPAKSAERIARIGRVVEFDVSRRVTQVAFSVLMPPAATRAVHVAALETPLAPTRLTDPARWVGYPAWSPDDRVLAVEVKDGSSTHAAVIDIASGALRQLTAARGQTWVRSFSPDGRRIAAAVLRDGRWSLRWIAVDGTGEGELLPPVPPGTYVRYPEWSPRGDRLVFERAEMSGDIWTLEIRR